MTHKRKIRATVLALALISLAGVPALADQEALMDPSALAAEAPESYSVKFETSAGEFVIEVTREWAPLGADRFFNLASNGFFDNARFFRVLDGFVAQFGINGDPLVSKVWREARIDDDPVTQSNNRGSIVFATSGANSRTTQLFINFKDNTRLDSMGFAPFGTVTEGMQIVDSLYSGYGEGAPRGHGPRQDLIQSRGNSYLESDFPELDFIKKTTVVTAQPAEAAE